MFNNLIDNLIDMDLESKNRVYNASNYDDIFYEDVESNIKLKKRIEVFQQRAKELGGEENRFTEELFARFHSGASLLDKPKAAAWEPRVHEAVSRDESFQSLKRKFLHDPAMSGLVTATFAQKLSSSLELFFKEEKSNEDNSDTPSDSEWQQGMVIAEAMEAVEEVAEVSDLMESIGLVPGDGEDDKDDRVEIALFLLNNEEAKEAIRNAGRLYRSNNRAKRKTEGSTEVVGIECGSDLDWILPSELLFLRNPKTRSAKLLEIIEEKTFQYKLNSLESKERGPILVLRDVSGSMRSFGRSMKAASIAMYTMKEANESNRAIGVLPFNNEPLTNFMVRKKSKEKISPLQFRKVLKQVNTGSTNISKAIILACEMLGENENSDLVIVTDGLCRITRPARECLEKTKALGARVYVIGVGADKGFSDELKELADEVIDCSDSSDFVAQCSGMKV